MAAAVLETRLDAATLLRAVNAHLPRDVAVVGCALARDGFDPRREATGKLYRYAVWNAQVASPLRRRRFHHVPAPLDVAGMKEAAGHLVGRHDFASFQAAGSGVTDTVRTLTRVELAGAAGAEIAYSLQGDGFLRHMVRNVVGTLLEVGAGRRPPGSLPELLAARDRTKAGPTAPARGLTLVRVDY